MSYTNDIKNLQIRNHDIPFLVIYSERLKLYFYTCFYFTPFLEYNLEVAP